MVWPWGWVCQAVRAPGVKWTSAAPARAVATGTATVSMYTAPVNQSAGPVEVSGALRVTCMFLLGDGWSGGSAVSVDCANDGLDGVGQDRSQETRPLWRHVLRVSVHQDVVDDDRAAIGRTEPRGRVDPVNVVTCRELQLLVGNSRVADTRRASDGARPHVGEVSRHAVGRDLGQHRHVGDEHCSVSRAVKEAEGRLDPVEPGAAITRGDPGER